MQESFNSLFSVQSNYIQALFEESPNKKELSKKIKEANKKKEQEEKLELKKKKDLQKMKFEK